MLALLSLTLTGCEFIFREGRVIEAAEVRNTSEEPTWIAAVSLPDRILVQLDPGELGPACLVDAVDVGVYGTDPTTAPRPEPLFTIAFDGGDFCAGTYRWDGSTLTKIE